MQCTTPIIHNDAISMNYIKIIIIFLLFLTACQHKKPVLQLSVYCYDFKELQKNNRYFGVATVKNVGNDTLKILQIDTGGGCTSASVTKNLLQPQDTCTLNFIYNTQYKQGVQEEYVYIYANTDSLIHLLKIRAFVCDYSN